MTDRPTTPLPADDDWLDRALRADADESRAYLHDDGFTARVMGALPVPVAVPAWRRPAVGALWAAGVVAGGLALPSLYADVAHEAFRLLAQPFSLPQLAAGIAVLGAAMWSAAAWSLRED